MISVNKSADPAAIMTSNVVIMPEQPAAHMPGLFFVKTRGMTAKTVSDSERLNQFGTEATRKIPHQNRTPCFLG